MIPIAELKERIGEESSDHDDVIERLEKAAVDYLQQRTGKTFGEPAQRIDYVSGNGTRELWLDNLPAASPAPVVEVEDSPGEWEVVLATDYAIRDYRLIHDDYWVRGSENYRVTYTAGFEVGSEPERAREAVIGIVGHWYHNAQPGLVRSETIADFSYELDRYELDRNALPDRVELLIQGLSWQRV